MAVTVIDGPDGEPISLSEAKQHLKQEDLDAEDELLIAYISAARDAAERYTNRAIPLQTFEQTFDYEWPTFEDSFGCRPRLVLQRPPLAGVSSVAYIDDAGVEQTLDPASYTVFKLATGESAIEPSYGVTWPTPRQQPAAITVTFTAGSDAGATPHALRAAMLQLIAHFAVNREAVNVGNIVTTMPLSASFLLDQQRVFPG